MAPVAGPQPCGVEALTCAFNAMSFKLPFPSLTNLRISIMDIDSETLVKTFGKLPLLKWACVPSSSRSSFEALVYNVSFPNLQRIDRHSSAESISVDVVLNCLMERCERNAEIQMICLVRCFFNDIKRLKEIVVNVAYCNNANFKFKFPSKLC